MNDLSIWTYVGVAAAALLAFVFGMWMQTKNELSVAKFQNEWMRGMLREHGIHILDQVQRARWSKKKA